MTTSCVIVGCQPNKQTKKLEMDEGRKGRERGREGRRGLGKEAGGVETDRERRREEGRAG